MSSYRKLTRDQRAKVVERLAKRDGAFLKPLERAALVEALRKRAVVGALAAAGRAMRAADPVQRRAGAALLAREGARAVNAQRTPEERRAVAQKANESLTPAQRTARKCRMRDVTGRFVAVSA